MGIEAPKKTSGGASYRTKRPSSVIDLCSREKADWVLKFYIKGAAGQKYHNPRIGVYNLASKLKLKEISLPAKLDGSTAEWQEVKIPLKDFQENKADQFDSFAGFMLRSGGGHSEPLYIDQISLEPM